MSYANLRKLLEDDRIHVAAAVVATLDGESSHYATNEEGDIIVSCLVQQGGTPVWANLGALVGAKGQGVWVIPDPGVEVMLGFDKGNFEGEAYLIACAPSGNSPSGLAPGTVYVLGLSVVIAQTPGAAQKMILGETYRAAEDTYLTATEALITIIAAAPALAVYFASGAPATALSTWTTAVANFHAAAASYLAQIGKVE